MRHSTRVTGKQTGWTPTGIILKNGQTVQISASGLISFGPFGSWQFSPDGEPNRFAQGAAPALGLPANSLVAKAGGLPVYIGHSGEITATGEAQLSLASNDDHHADNDGHWNVFIDIK